MELLFLGTGAGTPSKERNVTAIALKLFEERGTFWLFDCGEATQHQILRTSLKLSKLEKLFVTHLHGDHIFGLPGLLASRSHQGATTALTIYGPQGICSYVDTCLNTTQARLNYELIIEEIEEGIVFQDDQFTVKTNKLDHRIESYGYRIVEREKPGRLRVELLKEHGVSPGPIYARIKHGENVQLDDGQWLQAADYIDESIPGRIVVIMGDTRICEGSRRLSRNADVLVHEATFSGELRQLAYEYHHTSAPDLAKMAAECGVKQLIMTHISSRYASKDAEKLLIEAKAHHDATVLANDFWSYDIPRKVN